MQKVFNILYGVAVVLLILVYTQEAIATILLATAPYHVIFNR